MVLAKLAFVKNLSTRQLLSRTQYIVEGGGSSLYTDSCLTMAVFWPKSGV
jgi:hypothetical protein